MAYREKPSATMKIRFFPFHAPVYSFCRVASLLPNHWCMDFKVSLEAFSASVSKSMSMVLG